MSSWKSLPSRCGCARKPCSRINARKSRLPLSKSREAQTQAREERQNQASAADVSGALQLRDHVRRGGELRSSRHGLEPLPGVSGLRQKTRSQEPPAADGISPGGILEGGRVLACPSGWTLQF